MICEIMKKVTFIGDVHANFSEYFFIVDRLENDSIQLGDMGIWQGVKGEYKKYLIEFPNPNHKFIRGNHDDPEMCRKHKNYLGDYGITEDGIFFVSGAYSIDKCYRTPMFDWWTDEELSIAEFYNVLELYEKEKPEIVISHGCPNEITELTTNFGFVEKSRTADYFSEMLRLHKPKKWFFGHMHSNFDDVVNDVYFSCLNILVTYTIEV